MFRQQTSWKSYTKLLETLAEQAGQSLQITPESDQAIEQSLLNEFSGRLRRDEPQAHELLNRLNLSLSHYRQHLRYLGFWDVNRRRLLAHGASLRLLEDHATEAQAGHLAELQLSGDVAEQRRQLSRHLVQRRGPPLGAQSAPGWLDPSADLPVKPTSDPKSIWVFPSSELAEPDMLHPMVARSLVARYLPRRGGVLVDPMAGTGTIAREASRLGHRAWASDLHPGAEFVARYDLAERGLSTHIGEGVADLLVLHPPIRHQTNADLEEFDAQVGQFIDNSILCVKEGGLVALVVSSEDAAGALQSVTSLLVDATNYQRLGRVDKYGLTAHHLAVARNGSQAWHILIARFGGTG